MRLKQLLRQGHIVVGTWNVIPSPDVVEICASSGLDFIIIDFEHGPHGYETAQNCCRSAYLQGCAPIVRTSHLDAAEIQRALEIGSEGVMVPRIQSAQMAKSVCDATKYFPNGSRGHSPFTRAGGFSNEGAQERIKFLNDKTVCCLLIEDKAGIESLSDIVAAVGDQVDVIYIGPYDLSHAVGRPGDIYHTDVVEAITGCFATIRDGGCAPGTLITDKNSYDMYTGCGAQFLAYKADAGILSDAVASVVGFSQD